MSTFSPFQAKEKSIPQIDLWSEQSTSHCDLCQKDRPSQRYGYHAYRESSSTSRELETPLPSTITTTTYQGFINGSAMICEHCARWQAVRKVFITLACIALTIGGIIFVLWAGRQGWFSHSGGWGAAFINVLGPIGLLLLASIPLLHLEGLPEGAIGNEAAVRAHRKRLRSYGFRHVKPGHVHYGHLTSNCNCEDHDR